MKESTPERILYLLKCSIFKALPTDEALFGVDSSTFPDGVEWSDIAAVAQNTGTFSLLYDTVAYFSHRQEMNPEFLAQWQKISLTLMLHRIEQYTAIRRLAQQIDALGLQIIFFKGVLLADLYPHYAHRSFADTDLLAKEEDLPQAVDMLHNLGYRQNQTASKANVLVFERQNPYHMVELHTHLWEDYEGNKIDILRSLNLTGKDNFYRTKACGIDVWTLKPTQHLIYQIFHIVKHFMLEGIGVRYLVDLTLFVHFYHNEIDFDKFWRDVTLLGYNDFCRHLFTICTTWLGLSPSFFPGINLNPNQQTAMLLLDMFQGGVLYPKEAAWQILGTMTPYFTGEKTVKKSKFGRKLDAIFLRPKDLTKDYAYAKKCPLLLPVAWAHRAGRYLHGWATHRKLLYNPNEKLGVTEYRLNMLVNLGLAEQTKGNHLEQS